MASATGSRHAGLLVIRIGGAVVILHMAGRAIRSGEVELPISVALRALQGGMRAGERKTNKIMIETCWLPSARGVTGLACLGQIQTYVARVRGLLVVRQVTAGAGCRRALKFIARVASRAVQRGMHSGQREAGVLQMIKINAEPVVHLVALFAGGGESG